MGSPASVASWFDRIMAGALLALTFVIGAAKMHAPIEDAQHYRHLQRLQVEQRDDLIFLDDRPAPSGWVGPLAR